jgi:5-methylcytosine-specific restriction protein A
MSESLIELSRILGLEIVESPLELGTGFTFALRLRDLPEPHGFEIRVQQTLMSSRAQLFLDSFSGELLSTLSQSYKLRKSQIENVFEAANTAGVVIDFNVNDGLNSENDLPDRWDSFNLSVNKKIVNFDDASTGLKMVIIFAFSVLLPLITEDSEELLEYSSSNFKEEGRRYSIEVNKYERSRVNRAIALEIHGFSCFACKNKMSDLYGPIGEGVIHVHHLEPVSLMEGPRVLNPALDLVPLCPNCHSIAHRRKPPLNISELEEIIRK